MATPIIKGVDSDEQHRSTPKEIRFRITEQAHLPEARTERTITICKTSEIPAGTGRIVQNDKDSIGVFNLAGRFHAVQNFCPHQGAPLCRGKVSATFRPGEPQATAEGVLRCPWHGWEFDMATGQGLHGLDSQAAIYEVRIDAEENIVLLL